MRGLERAQIGHDGLSPRGGGVALAAGWGAGSVGGGGGVGHRAAAADPAGGDGRGQARAGARGAVGGRLGGCREAGVARAEDAVQDGEGRRPSPDLRTGGDGAARVEKKKGL